MPVKIEAWALYKKIRVPHIYIITSHYSGQAPCKGGLYEVDFKPGSLSTSIQLYSITHSSL